MTTTTAVEVPAEASEDPDRRRVLRGALAFGAGLSIGFQAVARAQAQAPAASGLAPNAWVRMAQDGTVTLSLPKSEMGQGVYTAMAMIIAEELDVDLAKVHVFLPPADKRYAIGTMGQLTGGSTSLTQTWKPLRTAAATARAILVDAAARQWGVAAQACTTAVGEVLHSPTGRRIQYAALVNAAAQLPIPHSVQLKDPKTFRIIGTSTRRLDAAGKVDGTATYGIDVRVPGMKIAAVSASPVFGGKLKSVDEAAALKVRGVLRVVKLADAVAVIGDHMWAAKKGLAQLKPQWVAGPNAGLNQADIVAQLAEATERPGALARNVGDAGAALAGAPRTLSAVYMTPYLAHAAMEPMNCVVHVSDGGCEMWTGCQDPGAYKLDVAKVLGIAPEKVVIHNYLIGGGFGRKNETDLATQAALIARQLDHPVKVVWSREEDVQHDFYQPVYRDRLEAALDPQGLPLAWTHRMAGSSVFARTFGALPRGIDPIAVECAADPLYDVPNFRMEFSRQESAVPTGFWRGVGPTHSVFVVESFIDELAAAAGKDPVAYRRGLIKDERARAVLDLVAQKARWGEPVPAGWGRGVSVFHAFGSYLATVAEVSVLQGKVRVHHVVSAIDCGLPINPKNIAAQVEGGAIYGLSAALAGEITIEKGRVQQSNFHDYPALRINEAPTFESHVVRSAEPPSGVGETGTAGIAAAVTNAVFAATGKRVRELPLSKFDFGVST